MSEEHAHELVIEDASELSNSITALNSESVAPSYDSQYTDMEDYYHRMEDDEISKANHHRRQRRMMMKPS